MTNCQIQIDLPPKPELRWASDYKSLMQCQICDGTEELRDWLPNFDTDPSTCFRVCLPCVFALCKGVGATREEIREYRLKEMKVKHE